MSTKVIFKVRDKVLLQVEHRIYLPQVGDNLVFNTDRYVVVKIEHRFADIEFAECTAVIVYLAAYYEPDDGPLSDVQHAAIREASKASSIPWQNFTEGLFSEPRKIETKEYMTITAVN